MPTAGHVFAEAVEPAAIHAVGLRVVVSRAPHAGRFEHRGQPFDQPARLGREAPMHADVERRLVRRFVNDRVRVFRPIGFALAGRHIEQEHAVG